jgi:hypothetical protein
LAVAVPETGSVPDCETTAEFVGELIETCGAAETGADRAGASSITVSIAALIFLKICFILFIPLIPLTLIVITLFYRVGILITTIVNLA